MKCEETLKRIPGLALDELDVEDRREVEAHLGSCASCRSEREQQDRAFGALRRLPAVETSASRRDATVAGMLKARDELVEQAILRRPARWPSRLLASAAAAVLLVSMGWVAFWPAPSWQVASLKGVARVVRGDEAGFLKAGDRVFLGDQVLLSEDGQAVLESGRARVRMEGGTSVVVRGRDRILLMQGKILAESEEALTILNSYGDRFVLAWGAAEQKVDLAAVAGSSTTNPGEQPVIKVQGSRFWTRVERGRGTLRGPGGELVLGAGEEGRLDDGGRPKN